ncbi:ABC transporter permease [Promicromonospora citrea]|uniref:Peptide ABC transporter permease n=1 Tax=Promicromonospora citrea TaxID=43677 RepID=A0A8H9L9H1_9MICO|nr:ABC transporter permease [Promicromonospora citrea]NNH51505.1 ABC transporter permease [Promicromonospora citrea]GGM40682.1 peptide ABC transporter permease [Promicromonospora citrea]HEV6955760.1 ABC transporter permease [Promicromonospora sp.]
MAAYVLRRVGGAVGVLWAAFTVSYLILYLLPSDPVAIMLDQGAGGERVDPARVAELRERYGFDQGPVQQYLTLLGRALTGDLGTSISSGAPVAGLIADALPQTAQLAGLALVLGLAGGTAIAGLASWTRAAWLRDLLLLLPPLGVAVPGFWVGLVLLHLFSFTWFVFPAVGNEGFSALVLPAVTLAVGLSAVVAQVLAQGLREAWRAPYVEVAFAKGAGRGRVLAAHVARNGSLPTVTVLGVLVGNLLGGTVVVETVFSRQGFGRLVENAVTTQDIPVVQGLVVVAAAVFVTTSLLADLAHPLLDPRVTTARGAR